MEMSILRKEFSHKNSHVSVNNDMEEACFELDDTDKAEELFRTLTDKELVREYEIFMGEENLTKDDIVPCGIIINLARKAKPDKHGIRHVYAFSVTPALIESDGTIALLTTYPIDNAELLEILSDTIYTMKGYHYED